MSSRDSYVTHEIGFSQEAINAILIGASGANPHHSTVVYPQKGEYKDYYKAIVVEKTVLDFYNPNAAIDALETRNITRVLAELDEFGRTKSHGNLYAIKAAEIIRALQAKVETLETSKNG